MAEHLGIGHTLISGWRNRRQRPSIQSLNQIAGVLGEDPRRLWVLAGLADAMEVGLLDGRPTVVPPLPHEMQRLVDLHNQLPEADRADLLRCVRLLVAGVEADQQARSGPQRRRAAG